jgi:phage terminase large subunit-like protein
MPTNQTPQPTKHPTILSRSPRQRHAHPGWHREVEEWSETYGATVVVFETNRRNLMSAACDRFYGQVVNKTLSHDADARLAQHLANAIVKETPQGALITKDRRGSKRKIDLAIAAVLAMEGTRLEPEEVTPYFAVF